MDINEISNRLAEASARGTASEFIEAVTLCDHHENGVPLEERISRIKGTKVRDELELAGEPIPILDYDKVAEYMESLGNVELSNAQKEIINVYGKITGLSNTERVVMTEDLRKGMSMMVEGASVLAEGLSVVNEFTKEHNKEEYSSFTEAIVK